MPTIVATIDSATTVTLGAVADLNPYAAPPAAWQAIHIHSKKNSNVLMAVMINANDFGCGDVFDDLLHQHVLIDCRVSRKEATDTLVATVHTGGCRAKNFN